MRILHVIRGMANSSGTTHIVGPLAVAQARLGHAVKIFTVEKPGEATVLPSPDLVESCCFPMTYRSLHYGWSRALARALRSQMPLTDAVHVHAIWNYPTWRAMREARRAGVPYMVAPHGSLESWALGRGRFSKKVYAALTEAPLYARAARFQALTAAEAAQIREFGVTVPTAIIPNGVDLEAIDAAGPAADLRRELGLPVAERLVIFLGRIFPKKGIDLLLKAFARVAAVENGVSLLIVGHDSGLGYEGEYRRLAAGLGLGDKVRFLGELRGARKVQVLKGADLFALTSYSEGLPVAVLEAMACGLPVLVTPGCNLPDVVRSAAGWEAAPEVEKVQEALLAGLAGDAERRRRGTNARRLVEERFTWPRIAALTLDEYARMAS